MNSLVLDFENKINDRDYSITDLLRHCLIIATKLKQDLFAEWVNNELNGYIGIKDVPNYRKISVSVKFLNPIHGWCPYIITDEKVNDDLNNLPIRNPISEIEALANSESKIIRLEPSIQVKKKLFASINFETDISYEGSKISIIRIIDCVKNEMLNWVLKLDENGIIDEEQTFTSEQIKQASKVTTQIINNFYGDKDKIDINQSIGSD